MVSSRSRRRHTAVAFVGLLIAVCGALFSTAGGTQAATGSARAGVTAAAPAPAGNGVRADHGVPAGSTQVASTAEASPSAVAPEDDSGGMPGCRKQQDGNHGTVPATAPSGTSQPLLPPLPLCLTPESHGALGAAHARPPVRGPDPLPPLSQAELSVLRV